MGNLGAIGYVRVSTREQAEHGISLAAQEKQIRMYCELRGIELVRIIRDPGVSAAKPLASRPGGKQLLQALEDKQAGQVVVYKLDRLFRSCIDALNVTNQWEESGVALSLMDLNIDTSTPMGRLFLTILASVAQMERELIGERIAAAMQHKKSKNEYTGGKIPYGYFVCEGNLVESEADLAAKSRTGLVGYAAVLAWSS